VGSLGAWGGGGEPPHRSRGAWGVYSPPRDERRGGESPRSTHVSGFELPGTCVLRGVSCPPEQKQAHAM
jgi:hypothetical protein